MITREELLAKCFGGRPDGIHDVAIGDMLRRVNVVRKAYGQPMYVSCFYRTPEWDRSKGRSGLSMHCQLRAVDFQDPSGALAEWCLEHLDVLEDAGLWMEKPYKKDMDGARVWITKGWVHLDSKVRKNRVFAP